MPIGKDSITKRVAKVSPTEENIAPELVATTAAAPKKPATKKNTGTKSTAKTTAPKKESTAAEAKTAEAKVDTTVLSNVAPETVEKVIGHKEDGKYDKVSIGDEMPNYLL